MVFSKGKPDVLRSIGNPTVLFFSGNQHYQDTAPVRRPVFGIGESLGNFRTVEVPDPLSSAPL